ncbi:MAG: methyl-accepting chemotaxis protein, partial [Oscillospiraceae bacterium]|nr:methyl-accepting chemotaxis protein [Oscillospiraceae bacterium]
MKFKSIMTQLCVYISVFILCICVIFCFIATNLSQSALTNSLNESLLKITEQSSAVVAERIKTYYSELTALAQNEIFYDLTLNKEKIITLLKQVKNDEGHLDIMVSDIQGNTFSADNVETNISDRNYFQEALKGNNFVSDPILRNTDKKMIMVFTSPIKNASGNIIGIIAIVRSGHELSDILSKITYAKTGYAYATNKAGTVVGHQDASLVDSFYNTINEAKTDADMQQLADLTRKMMSGQNGTGSYKYKGVIKYLGYSPIEGTEWSIALSAPHEEVFAEINSLTLIMILCSIVLVILGIIAAMILAKGFQKPIKKLVGVSERLAKGDLDIQISLDRKDELGTLANTLLTVSDNMSELLSDIRIASEQVASGAVQISESSEEISQGATEQASSVEELTAAIEEIASQTKLNAENAGKVDTITKESKKVAEIGNEKMKYMLKAMDDINVSSKSISKIIKAI